ncbi:Phenylacetate-coenzyme A ligase [Methanosarcina sp. MTP4]|uniref:phenylacetate--CoA ligase family protein n=1 Tax=Methanosarcina sp. MTP4 TaxID=1434100 RepID=UPI000615DB0A|nr:phenylacetate--CoA ligase family protein [Methanosarcina sp. MTP4]AKB24330.1 Phenylacetate-coenzyme A ligase [Methanosarcina sp. MTP4]
MNSVVARAITKAISKGRYEHLSIIKDYEYKSIPECRELQKELLFNILNYSLKTIPYYREFASKENIKISKNSIFEDIKKFPAMTKNLLSENFDVLKSDTFDGSYIKNTSGGSTGEPVTFLQDMSHREKGKAFKLFLDEWAGRIEGEKMVRLWGSERDIIKGHDGINGWVNENLLNIKMLNSFKMLESDMAKYVEIINQEQPKIIEAYAQSIYELSKFIKSNDLNVFSPNGIITSASTLYSDNKKLIEEVFGTKVFNRYGTREVGDVACSCDKDEGLHLNIFNQYVEILDDDLEPCEAGKIGKVYVTTLNNYVMPLIRYQIGDMAIPAKNEQCSCGRGLPLIETVVGRQTDVFRMKDGRVIPGEFFIHFIGVVYNKDYISKFQVIQKDYDFVLIKLVLKNEVQFNCYKEDIIKSIKYVMGQDCKVEFEFVEDIEPTKSGKYLYTINEVK